MLLTCSDGGGFGRELDLLGVGRPLKVGAQLARAARAEAVDDPALGPRARVAVSSRDADRIVALPSAAAPRARRAAGTTVVRIGARVRLASVPCIAVAVPEGGFAGEELALSAHAPGVGHPRAQARRAAPTAVIEVRGEVEVLIHGPIAIIVGFVAPLLAGGAGVHGREAGPVDALAARAAPGPVEGGDVDRELAGAARAQIHHRTARGPHLTAIVSRSGVEAIPSSGEVAEPRRLVPPDVDAKDGVPRVFAEAYIVTPEHERDLHLPERLANDRAQGIGADDDLVATAVCSAGAQGSRAEQQAQDHEARARDGAASAGMPSRAHPRPVVNARHARRV